MEPLKAVWVVWLRWEDLYERACDLEEVLREMAALPRRVVTLLLCSLLFGLDTDSRKQAQRELSELRRYLLDPRLRIRLAGVASSLGSDTQIIFHRRQLLVALQLAQSACSGQDIPDPEGVSFRFRVGSLLLKVSDLLGGPVLDEGNDTAALAAMLLPFTCDTLIPDRALSQIRALRLLRSSKWTTLKALQRTRTSIESRFGMSLDDVIALLFILDDKYREARLKGDRPILVPDRIFSKARQGGQIRAVLDELSTEYAELPSAVPQPSEVVENRAYRPFRERPLIRFEDNRYVCADFTSFTQGPSSALMWAVKQFAEGDEDVQRDWAYLVEEWLQGEFSRVAGKGFIAGPTLRGAEGADGLLDYGSRVILIEIKNAFIPDAIKFNPDKTGLAECLQAKLLKRGQIARAIKRLFGSQRDGAHWLRNMKPDSTERVVSVLPLMIVGDSSITSNAHIENLLAELVARDIQEVGRPEGLNVEPLTVVSVEDAQLLISIMREGTPLDSLLHERLIEDPGRGQTFHNFLAAVVNSGRHKPPFREEDFQEIRAFTESFWFSQGDPTELPWWH